MRRFLATASLLAVTVAACTQSVGTDTTEPIKIGYIGPLTGDAAGLGSDTLNGVRLAVDEVNAAGGIDGRSVQLIAEDGKCSGADAATAAQKLVSVDGVAAIIGGVCSGETLAAAPVTEASSVILLSPVSSSPDVTDAGAFVFRVYPSDALKGVAFARFFENNEYTRIAMISENTDFCQGVRTSVLENIDGSAEVVFDELVEPGTKDYRALFTRLQSTEFDVFLLNGQSDVTNGAMVQQLRELGFTQPVIGSDTSDSIGIYDIAGEAAEGVQAISVTDIDPDSAYGQAYTAAFGNPQWSLVYGAHAYDAATVLLRTMASVGTESIALRDALSAMPSHAGVTGVFHFDANGDVVGIPFALKRFESGAIVQVESIPLQ